MLDLHAGHGLHCGDDLVEVSRARGFDRHVAHLRAPLDPDEVDRSEAPFRIADRTRDVGERPRTIPEIEP